MAVRTVSTVVGTRRGCSGGSGCDPEKLGVAGIENQSQLDSFYELPSHCQSVSLRVLSAGRKPCRVGAVNPGLQAGELFSPG